MKCALITGASRGIGRATALKFAETGRYPMLCLTALKEKEKLYQLAEEIRSLHPEQTVLCFLGDMGDPETVEHLAEEIHCAGGRVSLLINNAAISLPGMLMDLSFTAWNRLISVNLSSVYLTCHAFQHDLLSAGPDSAEDTGRIINLSSVWGAVGASCEAAYSASKGGVTAFTKALSKELAPSHVAVNCLELGAVDTEMNGNLSEEEKLALAEEIPYGRFADPEEVAEAIALLSTMPSYVTGAVLRMDGGWIG